MAKSETFQDLSLTPPDEGQELGRWLYAELRAAILDGRLKRGPAHAVDAKPGKAIRSIARNSYGRVRHSAQRRLPWDAVGSGSYVAFDLPDESVPSTPNARSRCTPNPTRHSQIAAGRPSRECGCCPLRIRWDERSAPMSRRSICFPSTCGRESPDECFAKRHVRCTGKAMPAATCRCERQSRNMSAPRAVCTATTSQVIVTSGAQQALDLVARLLIDPGDPVWMEDPGYPGAVFALRAAGARIIPVPVDTRWTERRGSLQARAAREAGLRHACQSVPLGRLRCRPSAAGNCSIGPVAKTRGSSRMSTMPNIATAGRRYPRCRAWTVPDASSISERSPRCCSTRCGWDSWWCRNVLPMRSPPRAPYSTGILPRWIRRFWRSLFSKATLAITSGACARPMRAE